MREAIRQLKHATYAIANNEKIIGTCFVLAGNDNILTAAHVVANPQCHHYKDLVIVDHDKNRHSFDILKIDAGSDTAILLSPTLPSSEGLVLGDYSDVEEGDEILLCGFPFGSDYHVTHRGMISVKSIINGRESIQVDASVNQGNSGGPCVIVADKDIRFHLLSYRPRLFIKLCQHPSDLPLPHSA